MKLLLHLVTMNFRFPVALAAHAPLDALAAPVVEHAAPIIAHIPVPTVG